MKRTLFTIYLCFGLFICLGFSVAAVRGWRAPNFGVLDGSSSGGGGGYGRSFGGSWGGGK